MRVIPHCHLDLIGRHFFRWKRTMRHDRSEGGRVSVWTPWGSRLAPACAVLVAGGATGLLALGAVAEAREGGATPGAVVDRAALQVERDPACREVLPYGRPSTFHRRRAEQSTALDGRRIAQAGSAGRLLADRLPFVVAQGIYRRYIRIARSASGRMFALVPARNVTSYEPRPARCRAELRTLVKRRVRSRRRAFRVSAERLLNRLIRDRWAPRSPASLEGIRFLDYSAEHGIGGGSGADVGVIRRTGNWVTSSSTEAGEVERSTVAALLPDGVARIDVTYPRGRSSEPTLVRRYAHAIRRTLQVRDNVVSFRVPRNAEDAFPTRQVWRSASGEVLRVVRFPS